MNINYAKVNQLFNKADLLFNQLQEAIKNNASSSEIHKLEVEFKHASKIIKRYLNGKAVA